MGTPKQWIVLLVGIMLFSCSCSHQEAAPKLSPSSKFTLDSKSSCATYYGTGNETTVYLQNICNSSKTVNINWFGNQPPRIMKYRMNPGTGGCCYSREVFRQDINGQIVDDSPSSLGLGGRVNVTVQTRPLVGTQTGLYIVNTTGHHTYVEYSMIITHNGQPYGPPIHGNSGYELDPVGTAGDGSHQPIYILFPGYNYIVQSLQAEQDAD
jgi:hypothetical protein